MSAEQCAQRVMALLEMNEFKGGDEEQSSDSLGILQKEMGFLMQCLAVHPRVLENLDAAQNACSIAKVLCNSTRRSQSVLSGVGLAQVAGARHWRRIAREPRDTHMPLDTQMPLDDE